MTRDDIEQEGDEPTELGSWAETSMASAQELSERKYFPVRVSFLSPLQDCQSEAKAEDHKTL